MPKRLPPNHPGVTDWLRYLGDALFCLDNIEQAKANYDEALALFEKFGDHFACADVLAHLGYAEVVEGNHEAAKDYIQRSLSLYHDNLETQHSLGADKTISPDFLLCLNIRALLYVDEGEHERAVSLFSAAAALGSQIGYDPDLGMKGRVDDALYQVKTQLGLDLFNRAWDGGQVKSAKEVLFATGIGSENRT